MQQQLSQDSGQETPWRSYLLCWLSTLWCWDAMECFLCQKCQAPDWANIELKHILKRVRAGVEEKPDAP